MQIQEQFLLNDKTEFGRPYAEIIGNSLMLRNTLKLISVVAPTDSTVLILGETGTGKELVAKAIHSNSTRHHKTMVKVNCACLSPTLIESELFGHERGSFTGATERRIGKFEMAHNSTLFLDEIGELPLDLQVKLLRVLQEREIERIGGSTLIKVNVRIIAATNRDLEMEAKVGKFRPDLFYRLNIFPISMPALRQRQEDLPLLAAHFIQQLSKKIGKRVTNISKKALQEVMNYHWPGNIRELEHVIERSILLSTDSILKHVDLPNQRENSEVRLSNEFTQKTINENERDHILDTLKHCNGKIAGYNGAAQLLGVAASTLCSKIKRLGIKKVIC